MSTGVNIKQINRMYEYQSFQNPLYSVRFEESLYKNNLLSGLLSDFLYFFKTPFFQSNIKKQQWFYKLLLPNKQVI